jgi:hypothetical protein
MPERTHAPADDRSPRRPARLALGTFLSRKAALALTSQAVASVSNFTSTVVAARALTDAGQFSLFVLFFSLLFLVNNVQMALILKPMAIFGAALTGREADRHFGACLLHEAAWVLGVLVVSLAVCAGASPVGARVWAGALLFAGTFLFQQYFRFLLFTRTQTGRVLLLDLVGHGLRVVLLVAVHAAGRLTFQNVFVVLAIPAGLAAAGGVVQCRGVLTALSARRAVAVFRRSIAVSKWIFSYNVVVWLHANAFFFLVALVAGLSGPGALKACVNLLGPLNILFIGLTNLVLPIASRKYQQGHAAGLAALVRSMLLFCVGAAVLYGAVVVIRPAVFFSAFYGRHSAYAQHAALVPIFAVQCVLGAANRSYVLGLEAMRQTRAVFGSYVAGTAFSVGVTLSLVGALNLYGLALCWCLSTALVTFLNYRFYTSRIARLARGRADEAAPAPAPAEPAAACGGPPAP